MSGPMMSKPTGGKTSRLRSEAAGKDGVRRRAGEIGAYSVGMVLQRERFHGRGPRGVRSDGLEGDRTEANSGGRDGADSERWDSWAGRVRIRGEG